MLLSLVALKVPLAMLEGGQFTAYLTHLKKNDTRSLTLLTKETLILFKNLTNILEELEHWKYIAKQLEKNRNKIYEVEDMHEWSCLHSRDYYHLQYFCRLEYNCLD